VKFLAQGFFRRQIQVFVLLRFPEVFKESD